MGIKGLFPFLSDHAPMSIKESELKATTGRTIAIDASMSLYQFLVAVRQGEAFTNLSNDAGEVTSHIQGFLARTVKLLELGAKPVFVFDGKPPELKSQTLAGRKEKKAEADNEYEAALAEGDAEQIRKASHKTARATPQMNEDVQTLLKLLGCPVILAPSEAEASCAALCKAGKVDAVATEDMDVLTFGAPLMLKNLFDTESSRVGSKRPVYEITLQTMLDQLDVPMKTFIDFCILCGCDYCSSVRGIGPATAFKLLKTHGTIEAAIASLDEARRPNVDEWPIEGARQLFEQPEVVDPSSCQLAWSTPNYDGLRAFLIQRHSFNEARVGKYIERLKALKASGTQTRLDAFFRVGGPKSVPDSAKFDPFAKKAKGAAGSSGSGGKRPAAGQGKGAAGKQPKR